MSENNYVSVDAELTDVYKPLTDILGLQYDGTMSYEERVQKRYNYVKEQLELDPNYEGWDWVEYCGSANSTAKDHEFKLTRSVVSMISTKGKLATKCSGKGMSVSLGSISGRYLRTTFQNLNGKYIKAYIHRIIGCTFKPIPDKYKDKEIRDLIVNHDDGNRTRNLLSNVSWMTQQENLLHAVEIGKIPSGFGHAESLKATFTVPGEHYGETFLLNGYNQANEFGICYHTVRSAALKNKNTLFCDWEVAVCEDIVETPISPPDWYSIYIKEHQDERMKKYLDKDKNTDTFKGTEVFTGVETLTDILNIDYDETTLDERAKIRKAYIDLHPNVVHWEFMEYIPGKAYARENTTTPPWRTESVVISTDGEVGKVNLKGEVFTRGGPSGGYYKFVQKFGDYPQEHITIHRAMASTFIPVPDGCKLKAKLADNDNKNLTLDNIYWE